MNTYTNSGCYIYIRWAYTVEVQDNSLRLTHYMLCHFLGHPQGDIFILHPNLSVFGTDPANGSSRLENIAWTYLIFARFRNFLHFFRNFSQFYILHAEGRTLNISNASWELNSCAILAQKLLDSRGIWTLVARFRLWSKHTQMGPHPTTILVRRCLTSTSGWQHLFLDLSPHEIWRKPFYIIRGGL